MLEVIKGSSKVIKEKLLSRYQALNEETLKEEILRIFNKLNTSRNNYEGKRNKQEE